MNKTNERVSRPKRRKLRLDILKTEPSTFQFRLEETTEGHVRDLMDAVKTGQSLDPMTVWKRGDEDYVVVDGHHRHEAYRRCKVTKPVPVVIHEGSEREAQLLALAANTKTKLPMSKPERENAAWRLTCSELSYSKAETVKASGVSDSTVARMRRALRELLEQDMPVAETWLQAQLDLKGMKGEMDEGMREAMIETKAKALDAEIGDIIGRVGNQQWEALALVMDWRVRHENLIAIVDWHTENSDDDLNDLPF
jgi:ParB-like chromosome segregation protein Spo0J